MHGNIQETHTGPSRTFWGRSTSPTIRRFSTPTLSSGWPNWCARIAATTCRGPGPWPCPAPPPRSQAVTKVCNKYGIKIKPISTGWYHWAAPMKDNEPTCNSICGA